MCAAGALRALCARAKPGFGNASVWGTLASPSSLVDLCHIDRTVHPYFSAASSARPSLLFCSGMTMAIVGVGVLALAGGLATRILHDLGISLDFSLNSEVLNSWTSLAYSYHHRF